MYEQHFGLKKRPFRAVAKGTDVFVGPQTAKAMAGLKKALQTQDSVVTLSGPAGVGKTTIAGRVVELMAETHRAVSIARQKLDSADLLEFLAEELGVSSLPSGAIRRFREFRRRLAELEAENRRVLVIVEDAALLGAETLAELEALTAADAGEGNGAAIVLLGDARLGTLMRDPLLTRLTQRLRLRVELQGLNAAELRGYMMHCFRLAGADFEQVFDGQTAQAVHALTGGIPRVANQVVEAALQAAAEKSLSRVPCDVVVDIARREFGLTAEIPADRKARPQDAPPVAEPAAKAPVQDVVSPVSAPLLDADGDTPAEPVTTDEIPEDEHARPAQPIATDEARVQTHARPAETPVADAAQSDAGDETIPEFIQDTLPDLSVLSSEFDLDEEITVEARPETVTDIAKDAMPHAPNEDPAEPGLAREAVAEPVSTSTRDVPDWDKDPTCAELRPDLDALERAMAMAQDKDYDDDQPPPTLTDIVPPPPVAAPPQPPHKPVSEEIPEITLDNAIRERIASKSTQRPSSNERVAPEPVAASGEDSPEIRLPSSQSRKADAELERIAEELARAKTLEDVDDKLAETLFGEELNLIAAQVVARRPAEAPANEPLELVDDEPVAMAQTASGGAAVGHRPAGHGNAAHGRQVPRFVPQVEVATGTPASEEPLRKAKPEPVDTPDSIEDQITSMTQTLKALNVRPPISTDRPVGVRDDDDDDDDDDQKKGGFFSRFRRG